VQQRLQSVNRKRIASQRSWPPPFTGYDPFADKISAKKANF